MGCFSHVLFLRHGTVSSQRVYKLGCLSVELSKHAFFHLVSPHQIRKKILGWKNSSVSFAAYVCH